MKLGACHVETPFIELGQISTVLYFSYFVIIVPVISLIENYFVFLSFSSKNNITIPRLVSINNTSPKVFKRSFHTTSPCRLEFMQAAVDLANNNALLEIVSSAKDSVENFLLEKSTAMDNINIEKFINYFNKYTGAANL
jgi:hypothetical protein